MDQWISVETENFTPNAVKFIYNDVFKRPQAPETMSRDGAGLELATSVMVQEPRRQVSRSWSVISSRSRTSALAP